MALPIGERDQSSAGAGAALTDLSSAGAQAPKKQSRLVMFFKNAVAKVENSIHAPSTALSRRLSVASSIDLSDDETTDPSSNTSESENVAVPPVHLPAKMQLHLPSWKELSTRVNEAVAREVPTFTRAAPAPKPQSKLDRLADKVQRFADQVMKYIRLAFRYLLFIPAIALNAIVTVLKKCAVKAAKGDKKLKDLSNKKNELYAHLQNVQSKLGPQGLTHLKKINTQLVELYDNGMIEWGLAKLKQIDTALEELQEQGTAAVSGLPEQLKGIQTLLKDVYENGAQAVGKQKWKELRKQYKQAVEDLSPDQIDGAAGRALREMRVLLQRCAILEQLADVKDPSGNSRQVIRDILRGGLENLVRQLDHGTPQLSVIDEEEVVDAVPAGAPDTGESAALSDAETVVATTPRKSDEVATKPVELSGKEKAIAGLKATRRVILFIFKALLFIPKLLILALRDFFTYIVGAQSTIDEIKAQFSLDPNKPGKGLIDPLLGTLHEVCDEVEELLTHLGNHLAVLEEANVSNLLGNALDRANGIMDGVAHSDFLPNTLQQIRGILEYVNPILDDIILYGPLHNKKHARPPSPRDDVDAERLSPLTSDLSDDESAPAAAAPATLLAAATPEAPAAAQPAAPKGYERKGDFMAVVEDGIDGGVDRMLSNKAADMAFKPLQELVSFIADVFKYLFSAERITDPIERKLDQINGLLARGEKLAELSKALLERLNTQFEAVQPLVSKIEETGANVEAVYRAVQGNQDLMNEVLGRTEEAVHQAQTVLDDVATGGILYSAKKKWKELRKDLVNGYAKISSSVGFDKAARDEVARLEHSFATVSSLEAMARMNGSGELNSDAIKGFHATIRGLAEQLAPAPVAVAPDVVAAPATPAEVVGGIPPVAPQG